MHTQELLQEKLGMLCQCLVEPSWETFNGCVDFKDIGQGWEAGLAYTCRYVCPQALSPASCLFLRLPDHEFDLPNGHPSFQCLTFQVFNIPMCAMF